MTRENIQSVCDTICSILKAPHVKAQISFRACPLKCPALLEGKTLTVWPGAEPAELFFAIAWNIAAAWRKADADRAAVDAVVLTWIFFHQARVPAYINSAAAYDAAANILRALTDWEP